MTRPSMNFVLPLDERPPDLSPEHLPHGDAEPATTGEEVVAPLSPRGGPSVAAIGSHVRLLGREFLELSASYALLSENVSTVVMRVPLASYILQIDALKAAALDLQRSAGRKVRP